MDASWCNVGCNQQEAKLTCLEIMASIIFYEKPGCINNTRQKKLLMEAGHDVESHNLLDVRWDVSELRSFFGNLPVNEWFNTSAPAIKNGEVVPSDLDEKQALALMMADPLLIRRPLMQVGNHRKVGFNVASIDQWIGMSIDQEDSANVSSEALEQCPHENSHRCETVS